MAAKHDMSPYRGDTLSRGFDFWEDPEKTIPSDLTGITAAAEIRNMTNGKQIFPFECTVAPSGFANRVIIYMDGSVTGSLVKLGYWDLQLTYPDGRIWTAVAGKVTVIDDITESTR